VGEDRFLISASGCALATLTLRDVVMCDRTETHRAKTVAPSLEAPMHRAIYDARPLVNAVIHASPPYTTIVASSDIPVDSDLTVDTAYYLRRVTRVPFAPPGSDALAASVAQAAGEADVLILNNHGAVALGTTPKETLLRLEALELLCRMLVYGAMGVPLRGLSERQVLDFLHRLDRA
jgi:L-fuculose-phosphate aldolase